MRTVRLSYECVILATGLGVLGCAAEDATCLASMQGSCKGPLPNASAPLSERLAEIDVELAGGASGPHVRALHEYLTTYGYFPNDELRERHRTWRPIVDAPRDGDVYDEHTATAVRALQARSGLEQTGRVDEATLELLQMARCSVPEGVRAPDPSLKYDAVYGNGVWDDPTDVTWRVLSNAAIYEAGLNPPLVTVVASAAFAQWQEATSITFRNVSTGTADIQIWFEDISGPAEAWMPDDFGNDAGGDIRVDTDRSWSTDGTPSSTEYDLATVLLHEIGHAIGLSHSSVSVATMEAFILTGLPPERNLHVDDTVGASALYDAFVQVPGQARDIAVGGDGADTGTDPDVWIIGNTPASGGYVVQKWSGSSFVSVTDGGSGARIAVTYDGRPWVVAQSGTIWERSSSSTSSGGWTQRQGCAKDIGIGGISSFNLAVWVIGCDAKTGGFGVHKWNGTTFVADSVTSAAGVRIAVDHVGLPWLVNDAGEIWRRTTVSPSTGTWERVDGSAKDIGVGWSGYPWTLGTDTSNGGFEIFVWNDQDAGFNGSPPANAVDGVWLQLQGGATSISVGPDAEPWVAASDLTVHRTAR